MRISHLLFPRRRQSDSADSSIGGLLLKYGFITREQLRDAITAKLQASPDSLLGEILVARGACTREQVARTLATQVKARGVTPDYVRQAQDMIAGVHAQSEVIQAHLDAIRAAAEDVTAATPRLVQLKPVKT